MPVVRWEKPVIKERETASFFSAAWRFFLIECVAVGGEREKFIGVNCLRSEGMAGNEISNGVERGRLIFLFFQLFSVL